MLTPLDIENKRFSKQMMNGYSVEEVDEFLDEIGVDYAKKNKELLEVIPFLLCIYQIAFVYFLIPFF